MNQTELRQKILALVPDGAFIEASYVVSMLGLPAKLVWAEIVMMTFDGIFETKKADNAEGNVLLQRSNA